MFDPILISGVNPYVLTLLPFIIVAVTLAVRAGFKGYGKEISAGATQAIAVVISLGVAVATFALSGAPLPADVPGWSQLIIGLFSLQMAAYEVIVKRVMEKLGS